MHSQPSPVPEIPGLAQIRATRARIAPYIVETPVWEWRTREIRGRLPEGTRIFLKLELFQETGTFKVRGAVNALLSLDPEARERGVTAVSAGNHAIAVAYAAGLLGSTAKVVMPRTAPPGRVARCRDYGGQVELVDDVHQAFVRVRQIEQEEGRTFIHPFEDPRVILGQATAGLELAQQVPELDAVVVPIGGGGLAAGMASALKQIQPQVRIYGVEPRGADTMWRSFQAGTPQAIDRVHTIADSLGAPRAEPYSFGLCRQLLEDVVRVDDQALIQAMELLFQEMKLAVEPAGAASTAALLGPLRERVAGGRVALVLCGTNIDPATFCRLVNRR